MDNPDLVENIQELRDRLSGMINRLMMPSAQSNMMTSADGALLAASILFLAQELEKPTKWNRLGAKAVGEKMSIPTTFVPTLPLFVVAQPDKKNLSYIQSPTTGGFKACVMCTEELLAERWRDSSHADWIVCKLQHHEEIVRFLEQLKGLKADLTHVAFDPTPKSESSQRTVLSTLDEVIAWAKKGMESSRGGNSA